MPPQAAGPGVFDRANLVAWCVVPYDTRRRSPGDRAVMLDRLGLRRLAWDWRPEHVARFGEELDALAAHGIELTGLWVPHTVPDDDGALGRVDEDVTTLLAELERRDVRTALWTCLEFGEPGPVVPLGAAEQEARVARAADHLVPLVAAARDQGLTVALYNHLGWAGEPENLVAVVEELAARRLGGVGLVYQQHHGHAHLERFAELMALMVPHLVALGINGMEAGAHWGGRKVYPYGRGEWDLELARVVAESGWHGPVSILGHTMDDVELRLRDNLDGVDWVVGRLDGRVDVGEAPPPARIPEPVWPH